MAGPAHPQPVTEASPPPTDDIEAAYWALKAAPKMRIAEDGRKLSDLGVLPIVTDPSRYDARYGLGAYGRDYDLIRWGTNRYTASHVPEMFNEHGPTVSLEEFRAAIEMAFEANQMTTGAIVISAADVQMQQVAWLWAGRIPKGHITIIDGDPGIGKSTLSLDLAARATRGDAFPGDPATRDPMNVLVMTTEDSIETTIKPRLSAARADLDRVFFFPAKKDEEGNEVPLTIPDDLQLIEAVIRTLHIGLVIIDPLVAFFGKETDTNTDKDIRRALGPLFRSLQETDCACIALRHLTKDKSKAALYRGGGSIGITGQARSAFLVGYDPQDESANENDRRRVLVHVKSNLSPKATALAYRTVADVAWEGTTPFPTSRVEWIGEVDVSAEDVAAGAQPSRGPEAHARNQAESVLRQLLAEGPIRAAEAEADLTSQGFSRSTINRAKANLDVESIKKADGWWWQTPDQAEAAITGARLRHGGPEPAWYTGETNLRALRPDKPHLGCRTNSWEWQDGQGWVCLACHPEAA